MMKPKGHGHKGMKPPKPPMGAGGPATSGAGGPAVKPGRAGGAIAIKPTQNLKGFGHPAPGMKELTTDRGAFKIK